MARFAAVMAVMSLAAVATLAAPPPRTASAPPAAAARARAASVPAAAAPAPTAAASAAEFAGVLEPGKTYLAEMVYDANALRTWRPVKEVQVAKNSAWTIDWSNLQQFPALKAAAVRARPQRFLFRVVATDVQSGSPVLPWTSIYRCELLAVEPDAGPARAPSRRR